MRTWNTSPRSTAPNQTLELAPTVTSPTMVAVSATNAVGSRSGRLPPKPRIIDPSASHLPLPEVLVAERFEDPGSVERGRRRVRRLVVVRGHQHEVRLAAGLAAH